MIRTNEKPWNAAGVSRRSDCRRGGYRFAPWRFNPPSPPPPWNVKWSHIYRALVGLFAGMHSHVYEQLVPGVERPHTSGTTSPLARVLRACAPGHRFHVQFLDVPHQRFLTCPVHFYRAPVPFASSHSVLGIAWRTKTVRTK